jgi:hypothetical protein
MEFCRMESIAESPPFSETVGYLVVICIRVRQPEVPSPSGRGPGRGQSKWLLPPTLVPHGLHELDDDVPSPFILSRAPCGRGVLCGLRPSISRIDSLFKSGELVFQSGELVGGRIGEISGWLSGPAGRGVGVWRRGRRRRSARAPCGRFSAGGSARSRLLRWRPRGRGMAAPPRATALSRLRRRRR